jgi:hypothetical protein
MQWNFCHDYRKDPQLLIDVINQDTANAGWQSQQANNVHQQKLMIQ